ncbi:calcium-binding protein [Rhizobium sp.]
MARINGNSKNNTLEGTNRSDDIEGRGGNDVLFGFGGNDDIEGGTGNDRLYGGAGNDDLEGGSGNDVLNGGAGYNDLEGGLGNDVFIFNKGVTEIEDFGLGNDVVRIGSKLGVDNFEDLMALARSVDGGEDVLIDFGKHQLRFEDTRLADLKASDFEF